MQLLIAGIALWCLTHLFPATLPTQRDAAVNRLGEGPYRGLFSLLILASLLLMVFGWKAASPTPVYGAPLSAGPLSSLLVLAGFALFFAAKTPTHVKRLVRHPQMTGVFLWSSAHLLTNGDSRSVALFGSLAAWSLLEIVLINRREGPRTSLPQGTTRGDITTLVVAIVAFAVLGFLHQRLFGVPAMPVGQP